MRKVLLVFLLAFILILPAIARADSQKILNPENGHYYQRIDTKMTWTDAKSYCEKLGGHLATITSASEDSFVYNNLVKYIIKDFGHIWIGGDDIKKEGIWEWITGEKWNYQNWDENQPDNDQGHQDCLAYWYNSDKWDDDWCEYPNGFPFICEWDSSNQCSQSDLNQKYKEGYNAGYEAGKKFCQQNPSACGITVSSTTDCSSEYQSGYNNGYNKGYEDGKNSCSGSGGGENPFLPPTTSSQCATFDFFTNKFHVPCFQGSGATYWLDFKLVNQNPVQLELTKFGKNK